MRVEITYVNTCRMLLLASFSLSVAGHGSNARAQVPEAETVVRSAAVGALALRAGREAPSVQKAQGNREPISPAAMALVRQMSVAYRALRSYSDVTVIDDTEKTGSQNTVKMPQVRGIVHFSKPSRLAITATDETGTSRSVLDRNFHYLARSQNPEEYLRSAASAQLPNAILNTVVRGKLLGVGLFPRLLTGTDPISPIGSRLVSATLDAPGQVDGIAVDRITITSRLAPGDGEQNVLLAIGKSDHLLRQVTLLRTVQGKTITRTETHSNVRVNPTLGNDVLAFVPPSGARQVRQFQYRGENPPTSDTPMNPAIPRRRGRGNMMDAAPAAEAARAAEIATPPVSPAGDQSAVKLTILGEDGVTIPHPLIGRFDFGAVSPLDSPKIEHTFRVRNDGAGSVTLRRMERTTSGILATVVPSMASPAAAASAGTSGTAPPTLQPGEVLSLKLSVDLTAHRPGRVDQSVAILPYETYSNVTHLEMRGERLATVRFSTGSINFGKVPEGEARTAEFTATFDSRMLKGEKALSMTVLLPHLIIESAGPPVPAPASGEVSREASRTPGATRWVTQKYRLTLSKDAPKGNIFTYIQIRDKNSAKIENFVAGSGSSGQGQLPVLDNNPIALSPEWTTRVTGQVVGEVTAYPESVSFGILRPQQTRTLNIRLLGSSPDALKGAQVTAGDSWLSARLVSSQALGSQALGSLAPEPSVLDMHLLEVKLMPNTPRGALRSHVRITLASGYRLEVPVSGVTSEQANP